MASDEIEMVRMVSREEEEVEEGSGEVSAPSSPCKRVEPSKDVAEDVANGVAESSRPPGGGYHLAKILALGVTLYAASILLVYVRPDISPLWLWPAGLALFADICSSWWSTSLTCCGGRLSLARMKQSLFQSHPQLSGNVVGVLCATLGTYMLWKCRYIGKDPAQRASSLDDSSKNNCLLFFPYGSSSDREDDDQHEWSSMPMWVFPGAVLLVNAKLLLRHVFR